MLRWLVSLSDSPAAIDHEVGKVPLDRLILAGLGRLHPFVQRDLVGPVDVDLGHHVESNSVLFLDVFLDLLVGARLLAAELVAWEGHDGKALVSVDSPHIL